MAGNGDWDGIDEIAASLRGGQLLYRIAPSTVDGVCDWGAVVEAALRQPIGTPPLAQMTRRGDRVVILVDDLTRPTPQKSLLPALMDFLNGVGVEDDSAMVIVALGTHRYMTGAEMRERFGDAVLARLQVVNHLWKDPETFVDLGRTPRGTPLRVNRIAHEADLLIGVGSIVPHIYAGWGGGAKMVIPGICSHESIGPVHSLATGDGELLRLAGRAGTTCRREIEEGAAQVGLRFILNVVLDASGGGAWVGAGAPVETHRAGVAAAERIFVRDIPRPADVAIIDARPATIEYWQGIKALAHAARGVKPGGTAILVGEFPEGIETTHPDFASHALCSEEEIVRRWQSGKITDHVAVTPLRLHALARDHCEVICVSSGMSTEDKEKLGFRHADSIAEALELALAKQGASAEVGIIEFGGDVVPRAKTP